MLQEKIIRLTLLLTCGGLLVSALESISNHRIYQPARLQSWKHLKNNQLMAKLCRTGGPWLNRVFAYPNILALLLLRLALVVGVLLLGLQGSVVPALVLALTFVNVLYTIRSVYSVNGADQLSNILLVAVCISFCPDASGRIVLYSIGFIAFQSALAYLTSGLFKINTRWLNGYNLRSVLSTEMFGNPVLLRFLEKCTPLYAGLSMAMIALEILLGLSFLLPAWACLPVLAAGALFHLCIALVMGLNTFVWAFVATYPSVYFIASQVMN